MIFGCILNCKAEIRVWFPFIRSTSSSDAGVTFRMISHSKISLLEGHNSAPASEYSRSLNLLDSPAPLSTLTSCPFATKNETASGTSATRRSWKLNSLGIPITNLPFFLAISSISSIGRILPSFKSCLSNSGSFTIICIQF
ncbi:hypothetical protein D3C86_1533760 [compost metagenome]